MYKRAVEHEERKGTLSNYRDKGTRATSLEFTVALRRAACSNVYVKQTSDSKNATRILVRDFYAGVGHTDLYPRDEVLQLCKRVSSGPEKFVSDADRCTKLRALRADLEQLRLQEPSMHAVVFTHCTGAHAAIVEALKGRGFELCQFTGTTSPEQRHNAIRSFQSTMTANASSPVAKVFVVTVKTGSVGITLTAATRCYLFEPAFDPATEAQAAGRIRRLGQTRGVMVKRFVFRDSLDEAICQLHRAVREGKVKLVDGVIPPAGIQIVAPRS